MSQRYLQTSFDHESDLLSAARAVRQKGWKIIDAYTPYAVHGLDHAMGLRPSRLPWVCLLGGLIGAIGMLWFEHWTMAVDWPVNVGGKPWNSLPSDAPVAFEAAVLVAGFGSVLALLAVSRLYPGRRTRVPDERVTNDRFVLLIEQFDAGFSVNEASRFLREFDAVESHEVVVEGGHR